MPASNRLVPTDGRCIADGNDHIRFKSGWEEQVDLVERHHIGQLPSLHGGICDGTAVHQMTLPERSVDGEDTAPHHLLMVEDYGICRKRVPPISLKNASGVVSRMHDSVRVPSRLRTGFYSIFKYVASDVGRCETAFFPPYSSATTTGVAGTGHYGPSLTAARVLSRRKRRLLYQR